MNPDKEKAVIAAAAECLRQAGDEEITITGGSDREVIVTRPGSQSSSVYTEDEFIAKYTPVNAAPTSYEVAERAKGGPDLIKSLTPSQDEEIATLRRRVRQLEGERDSIVMGASIKLATARMTLQGLLNGGKLTGPEQMALQAVFDVLPSGAPQMRIW